MYNIGLFKLVDTYGQGSPLRSASPLPYESNNMGYDTATEFGPAVSMAVSRDICCRCRRGYKGRNRENFCLASDMFFDARRALCTLNNGTIGDRRG